MEIENMKEYYDLLGKFAVTNYALMYILKEKLLLRDDIINMYQEIYYNLMIFGINNIGLPDNEN